MTTLADIQRHVGVAPDGVWGPRTATAIATALGLGARKPRRLLDPAQFFGGIRPAVFGGKLTQPQVDGVTILLDAMGAAGWPVAWAAYGFATAAHETNRTMQPVREAYWLSEDWRKEKLRYWPWYGRGYVQLTWERNYRRADDELDLGGSLIANADRALEPKIAAEIMVKGMEEGWFAEGHSLPAHLPVERGTFAQFTDARRIINGTDKAGDIAALAMHFQDALSAGQWA